MNQEECEKRANDACLREKRENTDVRDERKKDGEKDQSEKELLRAPRDRMRESTRGSDRGVR